MNQSSYSPYKKAILFEQLADVPTQAVQKLDPFAAHLQCALPISKLQGSKKMLLALGAVLAVHFGVFYVAKHLPTSALLLKKTEPVAVEIVPPKPPEVIKPKVPPMVKQPKIPPVVSKPQPVQQPSAAKILAEKTVSKTPETVKPVAKSVPEPSLPTTRTATEKTVPAPVAPAKPAEAAPKPSSDNLQTTEAKGYAGYLSNPAPEYPDIALDRGWEGLVMLRVHVSATGSPLEINIKNSSNKKVLDDAAIRTVKRWKFSPALRGTTPVEGWVDVPIRFKLPN